MGLDSYMGVRRSVYLKKGQRKIDLDKIDKHSLDDYKSDDFGVANRVEITEQFCYWRKANQIHKWFVDNCADGEDDCKPIFVGDDKIKELYNICKRIVNMMDGSVCTIDKEIKAYYNKNGETYDESFKFDKNDLEGMMNRKLWSYTFKNKKVIDYCKENLPLPTTDGFFFGSVNYDCSYLHDIIKTILMFDRMFLKLEEYRKSEVWYDIEYQGSW